MKGVHSHESAIANSKIFCGNKNGKLNKIKTKNLTTCTGNEKRNVRRGLTAGKRVSSFFFMAPSFLRLQSPKP